VTVHASARKLAAALNEARRLHRTGRLAYYENQGNATSPVFVQRTSTANPFASAQMSGGSARPPEISTEMATSIS
jgi:hypothetical protein